MSAHEMAAKIVKAIPELERDGRLNQMLTIEAWLIDWQADIVEKTTVAAQRAIHQILSESYRGPL